MAEPAQRRLTYEEYLTLERDSGLKHEYLDGAAWCMAGGTYRHSAVIVNITGILYTALADGPCRPYSSDAKVRVLATGLATYPDISVFCGPAIRHPEDRNAATNPTMLIEVLSESTEASDRGFRFEHFSQIDSLQHYLLVAQDRPHIELFTRNPNGSWTLTRYRAGGTVPLPAVGASLPVDDAYRNLPNEPED